MLCIAFSLRHVKILEEVDMAKIVWKPIEMCSLTGIKFVSDLPEFNLRSDLLDRILDMKSGEPISLHEAYNLYWDATMDMLLNGGEVIPEEEVHDWLKWVTRKGFRIILDGSEYEIKEAA